MGFGSILLVESEPVNRGLLSNPVLLCVPYAPQSTGYWDQPGRETVAW